MGTRNLTCVVHEGKMKIAQYGQWDGYPSGNGLLIRGFLKKGFNRDKFLAGLNKCKLLTGKEVGKLYEKLGIVGTDGFVSMEDADRFKKTYPSLDRDMGANILRFIQKQKEEWFHSNQKDFGLDSLFCEWAYVLDLDNNVLEVYEGFNKVPVPSNNRWKGKHNNRGYYPVKLVKIYPLSDLPSKEDFLKDLEKEEDSE
jgi:hypothetical protein